MIDLNLKRQEITAVAAELFAKFVNLPKDVRPDEKPRTGIQVLVWQPGTRNFIFFPIGRPSEAAQFFAAEKATRSEYFSDMTSENSQHPPTMQFAGSVSMFLYDGEDSSDNEMLIRVSVSGLKAEEDVAISIGILSKISGKSFNGVCKLVSEWGGDLPDWYDEEDRRYFDFLFK